MIDPNQTSLETELSQRMLDLKRRAEACGGSWTSLCRDTGVARATVERWAERAPQTVRIFDTLRGRVIALEAETAEKLGQAGE